MFYVSPDIFISDMVVYKFVENIFVIHMTCMKAMWQNHLFSASEYLPQQPNE